jgi:uncharacterized surface protein with fasciclin (FAS1) repeats
MQRIFTVLALSAAFVAVAAAPASARTDLSAVSSGAEKNIVQTAVAAGKFKTLASLLKKADLAGTLQAKGPFTVFAPTDEAFAKLPAGTVESLLEPANRDELTAILTYHVIPAALPAAEVVKYDAAETVNGARLDIDAGSGGVKVNDANVTATDIMATNGVIHVIDAVVLPPAE